jgi:hypothetical protein
MPHSGAQAVIDANLTFPYLKSLRIGCICNMDASFFRSLSNLEYLDISWVDRFVSDAEQYSSCPFPRLKAYVGFAHLIPHFIPGSAIRATCLKCSTLLPRTHWNELMACLRQSTVPIEQFSVGPLGLQTDMILAIPDYLPDLHVLNLIQNVNNEQVRGCFPSITCYPTERIYIHKDRQRFPDSHPAIIEILPRMRRLHRLQVAEMPRRGKFSMTADDKRDQNEAVIFGSKCSSLERITIREFKCVCVCVYNLI